MRSTANEPAAPKAEATALLPMYKPIANLPISKRIAVTTAPTQTSRHAICVLGISLYIMANNVVLNSTETA